MMRWFDVSIVQGAVSLNRIGIFSPSMSNGSLSEGGYGLGACPFGGGVPTPLRYGERLLTRVSTEDLWYSASTAASDHRCAPRGVHSAASSNGHSRSPHRAPITVAEWIRRTFDRVDPP